MMDSLRRLAGQLEHAAVELVTERPEDLDPAGAVAGTGSPGEVASALAGQLTAALHARTREAARAAERLGGLAADLRTAADGYSGVDRDAGSRATGVER